MLTMASCRTVLLGALLALLPLGLCRPVRAQNPPNAANNTYVVTQAPYDADSSGSTDAAPAINQAVSNAVAYGNANNVAVTVSLPAGTYYLNSASISVSNVKNAFTLTGHTSGDTFLTYNNNNSGQNHQVLNMQSNPGSLTVGNFTEDVCSASQIAFTQGTITGFDRAANPPTITVKVEAGYPLLNRPDILADPTYNGNAGLAATLYTYSDPKRPTWDHNNAPQMKNISPSADGTTAVIAVSQIPPYAYVGEPWLIYDPPTEYITGNYDPESISNLIGGDNNVTVQNVNYYGGIEDVSGGGGQGNTGNIIFINYYQGPPPTPAQATATRPTRFLPDRRITTLEGFQCISRGTTSFTNCDMSGGQDDVLDIGGQMSRVLSQPAQNQIDVSGLSGIYQSGDHIELGTSDATAAVYTNPSLTVQNVQPQQDGSLLLTLNQNVTVQNTGTAGDLCTDLTAAGPITLTNSSFSSQFGRVFLKSGGVNGTGITVTGCTFHDFDFNGLAVVGSLHYGQGPLEARNVTIQGNTFKNCLQYACVIQDGTAATGSNVNVLNNTFLDTGSDPYDPSDGPALVLNSVSGATIAGNLFDRNWGANVACEFDQNLTIRGNTFSHPNFTRPPLATPYTGQPSNGFITPDPSSVVYLADDSGVTLSGNLVSSAGPYTQQLVEAPTSVTNALGLTSGITQVDAPVAFYLGYDGLVMDQPSTGSVLDQASWTGGNTQKWIATPVTAAPGYATLTDSSNGRLVGNAGSQSTGPNAPIVLEAPAYAPGTNTPALEQLWSLIPYDNTDANIVNGNSGFAVNVLYGATNPGVGLYQYTQGNYQNQDFEPLVPPAPVAQAGLEQVALTWAPTPYTGSYNVARATAPGGTYTTLATNLTGDTYTDATVTPGTAYYYQVIALGPPLSNNGSAPVAARAGAAFTGVPVNLAPAFNAAAIEPDGWTYLGGGFDGQGYAYSSQLLGLGACGGSLAWAGDLFTLGAPARPDCVADAGQRVVLPNGNFGSLLILGSYLGSGPTSTGTFSPTLTYTDGSRTVLSQGMTNWCGTASQPGESDAARFNYRDYASGGQQSLTDYVHGYQVAIDPKRTVQWLDLPSTGNFRILAMDLNAGPSTLAQGVTLSAGQYLASPTGKYFLTMQTDSNLCLYAGSGPSNQGGLVWQSRTAGSGGGYVTLQADGNLLMHTGTPAAPGSGVWATGTYGNPDTPLNAYLQVTDAGQMQVLFGGTVVWSNGANMEPPAQQPWQLLAGSLPAASLSPGQYLESPSGKYCLTMQANGNLVLSQGSSPAATGGQVLASATAENGGVFLTMQTDGNLVMYQGTPSAPGSYAGWATQTYGNPNAYLQVLDTGEAQVVSTAGAVLWQKP